MGNETSNVLAVLDHAAYYVAAVAYKHDKKPAEVSLEIKAARAAVAGLIERERMMRAALEDLRRQCANNLEVGATGPGYWTDAQETIDAALARTGAQS